MNHDPDVEKELLLWNGRHTAHPARDDYLGKDEFNRIYLWREVGRMSRFYREIMDKYSLPRGGALGGRLIWLSGVISTLPVREFDVIGY
jgi:hypothetical protein